MVTKYSYNSRLGCQHLKGNISGNCTVHYKRRTLRSYYHLFAFEVHLLSGWWRYFADAADHWKSTSFITLQACQHNDYFDSSYHFWESKDFLNHFGKQLLKMTHNDLKFTEKVAKCSKQFMSAML